MGLAAQLAAAAEEQAQVQAEKDRRLDPRFLDHVMNFDARFLGLK